MAYRTSPVNITPVKGLLIFLFYACVNNNMNYQQNIIKITHKILKISNKKGH